MSTTSKGTSPFLAALDKRVLVLDGAMGTMIHDADLSLEKDYEGLENCLEVINRTRPDVIQSIHEEYLSVGCDGVETNTFGCTPITLGEFGIADQARELNRLAAQIARRACDAHSTAEKPRFVMGSLGPGTKLATLGQATYRELKESYAEQARGLIDGGVDAFAIETCQDPLQLKAAVNGVLLARRELNAEHLAIMVSVTMEVTGTMLVGTEMAAAIAILDPYPVDVVLLNCATGPREMGEHVRVLGQSCRKRIGVYPNAGLPQLVDGRPHYPLTPEELADWLKRFVVEDGLNIVGGCCGTTPEHMRSVVQHIGTHKPKDRQPSFQPQVASIYSSTNLRQDNSILLVGERCNTNGSKAFREALLDSDIDTMVQIGRKQVREGSHVLDVCAAYVGRDESADMTGIIDRFRKDITVPLTIDSTEVPVLETALELCGGRSIINSINLEDGDKRAREVLAIAREHGSAVIALTIDEDGMAKTADDKVRIAKRLHDLCVNECGLRSEDLLFDVLTFTICTGNEDDRKLGLETLEGIRRVREELHGVGTLLGLSNISFGINAAARHVLNSVFLHHAEDAGLTAAILHSGRIEPLHHIDDEVRQVCEDLIFDRRSEGYDPLTRLLELFEGVDVKAKADREVPSDVFERLKWRIVEGERQELENDLDLARQTKAPLQIINGDLLGGMAVVGDLFGRGEMQLPFVLQSAETMKAAVKHLEQFMERVEGQTRGKIVLATVRGDVHDIGKNLVDIILTNNGYTVFNLGIKQPIQKILEKTFHHRPDAIGLSGLLVKSTVIMRENLEEMNHRGIELPVILGGAALTRSYVEDDLRRIYNGPLYYARDAFEGLDIMGRIASGESRPGAETTRKKKKAAQAAADAAAAVVESSTGVGMRPEPEEWHDHKAAPDLPRDISYPVAPFLGPRIIEEINLQSVLPYVNETTLFQFQWGYRRKGKPQKDYKAFIDDHVRPIYHELSKTCASQEILRPCASYGYWKCIPEGDSLVLLHPEDDAREVARFAFPRQAGKKSLCISDFFHANDGKPDVIALMVVTVGQGASDTAREWFADDRYTDYLHLHGLGVEVAEGLAEYVHRQIRGELGIAADDERAMKRLLKQGYRGSRFSFGYPACPRLEDQEILLDLLQADRVGIKLSDEHQLWPEQSTSAIVCHHPNAKYFTL